MMIEELKKSASELRKNAVFLRNIYQSNTRELSSIAKLFFCLTFKCNLKCKICAIWKMPHRKELSVAEIEQMFRNLPNLSWLDLTGGEITLREDLVDVIRVIITNSKNLKSFHMNSNGMLTDEIMKAAQEVIRLKYRPYISISLDGPQAVHDVVRGTKGSYAQVVKTFKELKTLKDCKVQISCTISRYNFEYLEDFVATVKRDIPNLTNDDLHFNFYHVSGHYYDNEDLGEKGREGIQFEKIRSYLNPHSRKDFIKSFLDEKYVHYLEKYLKGERIPFVCQATHGSVFVDAYGTIFPCLFFNRPLGKLHENDYDINKVLSDPKLDQLKSDIVQKKCPNCWAPCEAYPMIIGNLGSFVFGNKKTLPSI